MSKRRFFFFKKTNIHQRFGLSLIELLIVISLVAILVLLALFLMRTQLARSHDARRKADLGLIKIAFEDYFNDKGCYPPVDVLQYCNEETFQPYLSKIPCDPTTNQPYVYAPLEGNMCKGYRVYAGLEDKTDPIITQLGCDPIAGCGYMAGYNYGISVGTEVESEAGSSVSSPQPTVTPSPSPSSSSTYVYACDTAGTCNQYEAGHPTLQTCPITFEDRNCSHSCNNSANWCNE